MNNFDTQEKLDTIDAAIESVLNEKNIDWKNEQLHSWGYTTGLEALDIMKVYGHNGTVVKGVNTKHIADNVSVKFVEIKTSSSKKPEFVLELTAQLYTNTSPYNIVVSNVAPEPKLFDGHKLYSEIGKWYTGLR